MTSLFTLLNGTRALDVVQNPESAAECVKFFFACLPQMTAFENFINVKSYRIAGLKGIAKCAL